MGEITLIIGGASGIGRACAEKFSEEGYNVVIADVKKADNVCREIRKKGNFCSYVLLDIRSTESIEKMIDRIKKKKDKIKILINSAGINAPNRSFKDMDDKTTRDIIATNLTGAVNVSRAVIKEMREYKGIIIHIGSVAGVKTTKMSGVAYCAAKKGLFSLVKSINLEEAENGIKASIIAPATVNTELLLKRPNPPTEEERREKIQPDTIADIAYFIATQPKNVLIEQIILTSLSEVDLL